MRVRGFYHASEGEEGTNSLCFHLVPCMQERPEATFVVPTGRGKVLCFKFQTFKKPACATSGFDFGDLTVIELKLADL